MKINKFLKGIIELIGLIAIVVIIMINLAYNVSLNNRMSEDIVINSNDVILILGYIISVIAIYYVLYKSKNIKLSKKTKNIILISLFVIYFIMQVLWINIRSANPNYDQYYMYDTAVKMKDGNTDLMGDSYLQMYPQQISTASFYAVILKLFNTNDVKVLQYANAIANTFTILGLYLISKKIANKENSLNTFAFIIYGFTFTALPLLSTFIYGDFISLPFAIFAIYYIMKYSGENKARYLVASALLMSMSYFLRMNMLIFVVAITIYLILGLIQFIAKISKEQIPPKSKVLQSTLKVGFIIIFVLVSIIPTNLYKAFMQNKLGLDKEKAFPTIGFLDIGITRATRGYGWYADLFGDGWRDGTLTKEVYKLDFQKKLAEFKNPENFMEFYTKKIASMWAECTFGSVWYNLSFNFGDMSVNEGTATEEQILEYENVDKEVLRFYNLNKTYEKILVLLIFSAVLIFMLRNNNITNEQALLILIFIGGFLFHILWEAKSRYIIPYVIILIPIASIGIKETCEWIKNIVKKVTSKNNKKQED